MHGHGTSDISRSSGQSSISGLYNNRVKSMDDVQIGRFDNRRHPQGSSGSGGSGGHNQTHPHPHPHGHSRGGHDHGGEKHSVRFMQPGQFPSYDINSINNNNVGGTNFYGDQMSGMMAGAPAMTGMDGLSSSFPQSILKPATATAPTSSISSQFSKLPPAFAAALQRAQAASVNPTASHPTYPTSSTMPAPAPAPAPQISGSPTTTLYPGHGRAGVPHTIIKPPTTTAIGGSIPVAQQDPSTQTLVPAVSMSVPEEVKEEPFPVDIEQTDQGVKITYKGKTVFVNHGHSVEAPPAIICPPKLSAIHALEPSSGSHKDRVKIVGSNFKRSSYVVWGENIIADGWVKNANEIHIQVPEKKGPAGSVAVYISDDDWGKSNTVEFTQYR